MGIPEQMAETVQGWEAARQKPQLNDLVVEKLKRWGLEPHVEEIAYLPVVCGDFDAAGAPHNDQARGQIARLNDVLPGVITCGIDGAASVALIQNPRIRSNFARLGIDLAVVTDRQEEDPVQLPLGVVNVLEKSHWDPKCTHLLKKK